MRRAILAYWFGLFLARKNPNGRIVSRFVRVPSKSTNTNVMSGPPEAASDPRGRCPDRHRFGTTFSSTDPSTAPTAPRPETAGDHPSTGRRTRLLGSPLKTDAVD